MVEPFWAVVTFIPVFHFPDCLPDLGVEQDGFVDHHPDRGGSSWERAPGLIFEMALVKTQDAKVAVCRLPAAHERFFNELLHEGHGVFPLFQWWVGCRYSRIVDAELEGHVLGFWPAHRGRSRAPGPGAPTRPKMLHNQVLAG